MTIVEVHTQPQSAHDVALHTIHQDGTDAYTTAWLILDALEDGHDHIAIAGDGDVTILNKSIITCITVSNA